MPLGTVPLPRRSRLNRGYLAARRSSTPTTATARTSRQVVVAHDRHAASSSLLDARLGRPDARTAPSCPGSSADRRLTGRRCGSPAPAAHASTELGRRCCARSCTPASAEGMAVELAPRLAGAVHRGRRRRLGRALRVVRRQRLVWSAARPACWSWTPTRPARRPAEVVEDVRALGAGEVVAVVNTHEHFDHTFGNGAFRAAYGAVPVHAHEVAAESTVAAGRADQGAVRRPRERRRPAARRDAGDRDRGGRHDVLLRGRPRPRRPAGRAGPPRPRPHRRRPGGPRPRRRRGAGRRPGRGVPVRTACPASATTATRWSGRSRSTSCWACSPRRRSWSPATAPRSTGSSSRSSATRSASSPRRSATWPPAASPSTEALAAAEWPYPREELAAAVRRGYEQLPRSQKRLPLV